MSSSSIYTTNRTWRHTSHTFSNKTNCWCLNTFLYKSIYFQNHFKYYSSTHSQYVYMDVRYTHLLSIPRAWVRFWNFYDVIKKTSFKCTKTIYIIIASVAEWFECGLCNTTHKLSCGGCAIDVVIGRKHLFTFFAKNNIFLQRVNSYLLFLQGLGSGWNFVGLSVDTRDFLYGGWPPPQVTPFLGEAKKPAEKQHFSNDNFVQEIFPHQNRDQPRLYSFSRAFQRCPLDAAPTHSFSAIADQSLKIIFRPIFIVPPKLKDCKFSGNFFARRTDEGAGHWAALQIFGLQWSQRPQNSVENVEFFAIYRRNFPTFPYGFSKIVDRPLNRHSMACRLAPVWRLHDVQWPSSGHFAKTLQKTHFRP